MKIEASVTPYADNLSAAEIEKQLASDRCDITLLPSVIAITATIGAPADGIPSFIVAAGHS